MFRTFIVPALAYVALTVFATTASAREALTLAKACPQTGYPACVVTEMIWSNDDALPVEFAGLPDPGPSDTSVLASGTVAGRLRDGPRRRFKLEIRQDQYHIQAAFLGRSKANRPIVLTDRGPFEILAAGIDVAYGGKLVLIDMKTWRSTELLNVDNTVVSSSTDIGIWNDAAQVCIAAPTRRPGPLQVRKDGCKVRLDEEPGILTPWSVRTSDMNKVFPTVWPLPLDEDKDEIDRTREANEFGGDGGLFSVYRIKDSDVLVVTMIWDDC